MKRLLFLITLIFTFTAGVVSAGTFAPNGKFDNFPIIKIFSGGKELKPDKTPGILYKDSTLVPIGVLRSLGVDVKWDGKKYRVDVTLPVKTVYALTQAQLDELSKSVYEVITEPDTANPTGKQGSAFIIDGYAITNAHVAGDALSAMVKIDGHWQKVDKYDFVNTSVDVMGFKVTGGQSLPYSTMLPAVGDPVYDISYPGGVLTVTEGKVREITKGPTGYTEIIHTAEIDPGGSGGILLNGRGEIIGMNESELANTSFAIPISFVVDELNKVR